MEDILNDFYDSPVPASRLKRWLACFIDYLLCFLLTGIIQHFLDGRPIHGEIGMFDLEGLVRIGMLLLPWLLLLPGIETINNGKTFGKAFFKIKAIKSDGSKIDFGSSIVRHLLDCIDFLPLGGILGLALTTNNKKVQRLGDRVAQTMVIDASK